MPRSFAPWLWFAVDRYMWAPISSWVSRAGIDALKIHHLHLVRGTALAAEYARQPFRVLDYPEYLDLLCDFVERLDSRIVIERLFGEAPPKLLVAPSWRRTKNELITDIARIFEERDVRQGRRCGAGGHRTCDKILNKPRRGGQNLSPGR
jgi:radical SAM superfamily enzyme